MRLALLTVNWFVHSIKLLTLKPGMVKTPSLVRLTIRQIQKVLISTVLVTVHVCISCELYLLCIRSHKHFTFDCLLRAHSPYLRHSSSHNLYSESGEIQYAGVYGSNYASN